MAYDRVLVPVDGSPEARAILAYLPRLLPSPEAEVLLVRAVPFLSTLWELPRSLSSGPPPEASDTREIELEVESLARNLRDLGILARAVTRVAGNVDLIQQVIRKEEPTLIALSERPPEGPWSFLSDTLAERLARATSLPLFVLNVFGPARDWREAFPVQKGPVQLLVPLAGSPRAMDAVDLAARLSWPGGDSVRIEALVDANVSSAELLSAASRGVERCARAKVTASKRAVRGEPARLLFEVAHGESADLLVLSPRVLPGESSDPLGPLAAAVLRRSRVPVALAARRTTRALSTAPRSGNESEGPGEGALYASKVARPRARVGAISKLTDAGMKFESDGDEI